MKTLVYGGAFNPPSIAHIKLAEYAMRKTGCARVVFVPSKTRYIREDQQKEFAFNDTERLQMLGTIAAKHEWMIVSDYELNAETQPRTYQTLCHLRDQGFDCSLLFGSDKLPELENGWCYVEQIAKEFGIVCMERSDDDVHAMIQQDSYLKTLEPYITVLPTPEDFHHVSSTKIRALIADIREELKELDEILPEELNGLREYLLTHKEEDYEKPYD